MTLPKMGPIGCPETLVKDCYSTLLNIPEERKSEENNPLTGTIKVRVKNFTCL
jgi:hypothetical protein